MSEYSQRFQKPIGVTRQGMGGAAHNLGIEALAGSTEMVTVFDDFNGVVPTETYNGATNWETMGWVLTDVGVPVAEEVGMNDAADVSETFYSCIRSFAGTAADAGGNMQLDRVNASLPASAGGGDFPHIWIPETAAGVTIMDNTVWVFACRIGLRADLTTTGSGDWASKVFIGWAEAGDTSVMTAAGGAITVASTGPLVGFHIPENGAIDGISHRTVATAMAEGTNFTRMLAAGSVDGTVANGAKVPGDTMWFDLALRMTVTDMSETTGNGFTEFFYRQVPKVTAPVGDRPVEVPTQGGGTWVRHSTVLTDQTPNNDVALVPTFEHINSDDADKDSVVYIDSWAFGTSRFSRI